MNLSKTNYYRDKTMMEVVRDFPCASCGSEEEGVCGAHPNWSWAAKAKSIKGHDLVAALCPQCHYILDQGKDMSREEREYFWLRAFYKTQLYGFQAGVYEVKK